MAEFNIPKSGEICWRELASQDLDTAKSFYKSLFGWDVQPSKLTEVQYNEIHQGGQAVGGMMAIDKNWGDPLPPSHWTTYISVDDVDNTVEKITANGGSLKMPAFDAPNVGRIAYVNDPAGAHFAVIQFVKPS